MLASSVVRRTSLNKHTIFRATIYSIISTFNIQHTLPSFTQCCLEQIPLPSTRNSIEKYVATLSPTCRSEVESQPSTPLYSRIDFVSPHHPHVQCAKKVQFHITSSLFRVIFISAYCDVQLLLNAHLPIVCLAMVFPRPRPLITVLLLSQHGWCCPPPSPSQRSPPSHKKCTFHVMNACPPSTPKISLAKVVTARWMLKFVKWN